MKYTIMAEVVDSTAVYSIDEYGEIDQFSYSIDTEPYITSYGVYGDDGPIDWFDTMEEAENYINELAEGNLNGK